MSDYSFRSFISEKETIPEFSFLPLILGCLLGIVFGASSLYLALKVGMTVSASIPVAVLSITLFRGLSKALGLRRATILENNITQATGSAGESIAFGIAVTMPALLILGYDMELSRIMLVAVLGGLLGVLMMIPLRYGLVVKSHGELAYPEGTACAQVLMAGEKGGTSAFTVFSGFFLGLFYKFTNLGLRIFKDVPERTLSFFKGASVSIEVSPELLGVGYIIGPRIASIMLGGGILASWVLIPMIKLFGDGLSAPLFPATTLISEMSLHDIWKSYVLYIGAGAVAAGGIISLLQSLPTIIQGAISGLRGITAPAAKPERISRTEKDLPISMVLLGVLGIVATIWFAPSLHMNLLGAVLIVLFGFLFVTVSSRLTGEIGSSSNPISGMTVATLLLTCLAFLLIGWVGAEYRVTALSVAAIVCVAASNGGTTSQDLKTGFLLGGTPKYQQIGILLGAVTSALVIGFTLKLLNDASTIYSKNSIPAGTRVEDVSKLTVTEKAPQDPQEYRVLQLVETPSQGPLSKLRPGKYLVNASGEVVYLVDPGINGVLEAKDDGTKVPKYEAPKARLMSLIIDGILTQKLPWGLVLLGVSIALVLELCGIAALPFAVGVYLPLSASTPIFVGGIIRWLVEKIQARKGAVLSEEEKESGPGILFSSGLIAGGSIAGILLALMSVNDKWAKSLNVGDLWAGAQESNVLPLVFFGVLATLLSVTALSQKKKA
ncbi:MAG: oligopeptide transporter, OPT family [Proteobacteria bacterium]|nr:oligopeptide transporter, OPT family [Pseudomonadota bacterium]NDC23782.1 oligopeptide transporter, OPT family [Pseudomonadota bacterium]NDD03274.1 oligopeptide transporter, OPT family [Pseudomonadota bacterium]NDG25756.1 oligopeptide transporter, OPT family [Pseudomonadota bacterium]